VTRDSTGALQLKKKDREISDTFSPEVWKIPYFDVSCGLFVSGGMDCSITTDDMVAEVDVVDNVDGDFFMIPSFIFRFDER
jgi:asparagine synthetase B (glutamine-hydrolysing)